MGNFDLFNQIRAGSRRSDSEIRNHEALGVSPETRGIRIAWMYPDVLNMHGGRGDAMALLHFSNLLKLPCTIRRINALTDEIPFDWADMLFFPSGDFACMTDLCRALAPQRERFHSFAAAQGLIFAVGSTGAVLAEDTVYLDGHSVKGLGLLRMDMTQRKTVHGDDLWLTLPDGSELLGTQIQMADVALREGQEPFGTTVYGRGNCGDGREGARTGTVIFTHCLGPVLTRNPDFTVELLKLCASHGGVEVPGELPRDSVALEMEALEDLKTFIQKKIRGEIRV